MDILSIIGKFHPVLLHLPIGFLLIGFMMEITDRWKGTTTFQSAISFTLFWGMIGAISAAATGYFLSLNGGYEEQLLNRHQWLGFGVAGLSILLYFLQKRNTVEGSKYYFPLMVMTALILTIAGHLGGSLTHGSDFLSLTPNQESAKKEILNIEEAVVYTDIIQPILKEKCVRCHSTSKTKGELLMATIEGMQKGGETGALFVKGDAKKSLLLQRVHLPIAEKKHMPPKGKKQLLADEIKLLSWWIKEGANFQAKVKDLPKEEEINTILTKFITPKEDPMASLKVAAVATSTLESIRATGIPIYKVAAESSFVEVDLSRKKDINSNVLKRLNKVKDQLISLNLSATDIKDEDLKMINNFPHLQKLYLQQTTISDEGIQQLDNLDYLEYLNLYETKITDKSLLVLEGLKRLKKVFLWQTSTTSEGIAKLVNAKPKTMVNTGIDESVFGDARLKAPLIVSEKDLFKDSLEVELKMNFSKVNIYYTLDGSEPDSTANLYTKPIALTQTTALKAIAQKEGWQSSEVITKQFTRVKYAPVKITLSKPPHERYAGKGSKSLMDLEKGSTTFTDGQWLGYEKQHLIATMDFGKQEAISAVTVGALEAPGSYIFYPKGLTISISNDGKKYESVGTKNYPVATENKPTELANLTIDFTPQTARFVRVKVESPLVNPKWHPAPGAPCWIFIDEISVE